MDLTKLAILAGVLSFDTTFEDPIEKAMEDDAWVKAEMQKITGIGVGTIYVCLYMDSDSNIIVETSFDPVSGALETVPCRSKQEAEAMIEEMTLAYAKFGEVKVHRKA